MSDLPVTAERARRVIKRYSNRKLYDTKDSRYVTLQQIAEMVRGGDDVQIIDNSTKEDKTEATLALIISEELKSQPRGVPLGTLRDLIHQRRERLLSQLREHPIGRLIPGSVPGAPGGPGDKPVETAQVAEAQTERTERASDAPKASRLSDLVETSRQTLDHWQHTVDDRIRAVLPTFSAFRDLENEVRRLAVRVEELEARLSGGRGPDGTGR